MPDFAIYMKDGKDFGVDDIVINETGTIVKFIERYTHRRVVMSMSETCEIRRERRGWQGGPAFDEGEMKKWFRPI